MRNPRPRAQSPRATMTSFPPNGEPVCERDLLRALMEHLPDLIYFKDTESRFTHLNRPTAAALGCADPSDAVGKTDFDFYPKELARRFLADERQVLTTGVPLRNQFEAQTRVSDGSERWLLTSKAPVRDATGRVVGLVGSAKDVTEQRRAEELVRRSEARLQALLQHGWDMVSVLDEDGIRR